MLATERGQNVELVLLCPAGWEGEVASQPVFTHCRVMQREAPLAPVMSCTGGGFDL